MSVQAMTWALDQSVVKDSGARFVLLGLANHADEKGRHAFPALSTLSRYTGMSRRTVIRKIDLLLKAGVLVEGNQAIAAAHIKRADRRPTVYDIRMIDTPIQQGDSGTPGKERGDTGAPGENRGDTGAATGCHPDAGGVTSVQGRGDTVTPEPSLNRPNEPSLEPSTPGDEPPAPDAIQGELVPADSPEPTPQHDDQPRCEIPDDMPGPKDPTAKTYKAWANYAMAFRKRHGSWPIWNAKTAGLMGQLVDRVGAERAPKVAAYFVRINDSFYVSKLHPAWLLVKDCESIAVQMETNTQMTQSQARQADSTQGNLSSLDEAKQLLRTQRERRAANGS